MSLTFNIIILKPDDTIECIEETIESSDSSTRHGWDMSIFRLMTEKYKCYHSISHTGDQYARHWGSTGEYNRLGSFLIKTLKPIDKEDNECKGNCYLIRFDSSGSQPLSSTIDDFMEACDREYGKWKLIKVPGSETRYQWKRTGCVIL